MIDEIALRMRLSSEGYKLHECERLYVEIAKNEYIRDRASPYFQAMRGAIYAAPLYTWVFAGYGTWSFWASVALACLVYLIAELCTLSDGVAVVTSLLEFTEVAQEPLILDELLEYISEDMHDMLSSFLQKHPAAVVIVSRIYIEGHAGKTLSVYWTDGDSPFEVLESPVIEYLTNDN